MNGYYDLLFSKVFDAFNSQNDNLIFIAMAIIWKLTKDSKALKIHDLFQFSKKKIVNLTQFQSVR